MPWLPERLRFLLDVDPILSPDPFDVLTFDPTLMAWTALAPSGGASLDVDDDGLPVATNVGTLNFGVGLTATDDGGGQVTVDATGGGSGGLGPTGPWHQDNVAANQTDVALTLLDGVRTTIPAPAAAAATAIAVLSNEARTAGTLTVELTVNGVGSGLTATLDGTNTECDTGTGSVAVVECDEIGVTVTTDGSWTPTTADITVMLQLGAASGGGAVPGWITHLVADGTEDEGQEFDGTSGTGTKIEPSGSATATEAQGVLSVLFDSQASGNLTGFMFPLIGSWQAGSYIEAAIRLAAKNESNNNACIVVADDGGDALGVGDSTVAARLISGTTTTLNVSRGTFSAFIAASNASPPDLLARIGGGPLFYTRLTMVSSGTWRVEGSPDGVSWSAYGAGDLAGGITDITHYGFGVSRNGTGAEPAVATTEYLRVYDLA